MSEVMDDRGDDSISPGFPYFEDGNIVTSALKKDGKKVVYRVHGSVLKLHSDIFADMFTLPAGAANLNLHDGVPQVHLPDLAEDIGQLLKVPYDPSSLPTKHHDPDKPLLVSGILKLANKYHFDALRTCMVE
ncbi:hypothetical protein JAAARDRAFT_177496, partial [Jaapia argillacea MUCL 33604]